MMRIPRHFLGSQQRRTFKNFGHQRQRTPTVTVLWHGTLTFGFIGLGLEWKKIKEWIFGETDLSKLDVPMD